MKDKNLIVGIETSDDAAVYKISDELALVQTVDFFTPVVDDPYIYGQIAAANSLSDVYAMGGDPKLCMNIVCFPEDMPKEMIRGILKGGFDKVEEAGALVVGGHTIEDKEPKFGLSVTGFVHPDKALPNATAKVGDILVLTKPLGIGIINTAMKADMADEATASEAIECMRTLNKYAKEAMMKVGVNSCTDITGFGFLGHTLEMAEGSKVSIKINPNNVPIIKGAIDLAAMGIIPAGAYANMAHIEHKVEVKSQVSQAILDCMYDPQTSGGLLISLDKDKVNWLMDELKGLNTTYAIVGEVVEKQEKCIILED